MAVEILPPALPDGDDNEIGFASYVGEFDALLDTVHDERPSRLPQIDNNDDSDAMMAMGTTLRLLRQRHNCERYVSSMTQAQRIINSEGVLFGPGKVKNHVKELVGNLATYQPIVPPPSFGQTLTTLFEKGIIYQNSKDFISGNTNNVAVRGWSLKDFIEYSTWPTDSSGGGTRMVRYGLPVLEEEDDDVNEFTMISEPPSVAEMVLRNREEAAKDDQNPFVRRIIGEPGFYETIVREERDSVLFLSATFCRTCKTLNPRFTNLARTTMEESGSYGLEDENYNGLLFAKADTGGKAGKELSRLLNIDSVPAFVLFRKGKRFGPALSVSRIPSKQLSAAIALLKSGSDWDASVIQEAENERQ